MGQISYRQAKKPCKSRLLPVDLDAECRPAGGFLYATAGSLDFVQKRGQKWAPRRIGGGRCRDGAPTRRGCGSEPGFRAEKGSKVGATSYWRGAMSFWESNATWLTPGAWFLSRKWVKSGRHVALGECHVAMGFQRDVAAAVKLFFEQKVGQKRAPGRIGGARCRVGSPTRRDCGHPPHLPRKKIGRLSKLVL